MPLGARFSLLIEMCDPFSNMEYQEFYFIPKHNKNTKVEKSYQSYQ